MSDPEQYEDLSLFKKTGYSKVWKPVEKGKSDDESPDKEEDEIDQIDNGIVGSYCSETHLDLDAPQPDDEELKQKWINNSPKKRIIYHPKPSPIITARNIYRPLINELPQHRAFDDSLDYIPSFPPIDAIEPSPLKAASEITSRNKNLATKDTIDSNQKKKHEESKVCLVEVVDDEAKVKNCINRKDVVIKSILRSMRKYYADLLQDNSEYKRKMRNIKLKHQMLIQCSI